MQHGFQGARLPRDRGMSERGARANRCLEPGRPQVRWSG
jgi:hypothetical protein